MHLAAICSCAKTAGTTLKCIFSFAVGVEGVGLALAPAKSHEMASGLLLALMSLVCQCRTWQDHSCVPGIGLTVDPSLHTVKAYMLSTITCCQITHTVKPYMFETSLECRTRLGLWTSQARWQSALGTSTGDPMYVCMYVCYRYVVYLCMIYGIWYTHICYTVYIYVRMRACMCLLGLRMIPAVWNAHGSWCCRCISVGMMCMRTDYARNWKSQGCTGYKVRCHVALMKHAI